MLLKGMTVPQNILAAMNPAKVKRGQLHQLTDLPNVGMCSVDIGLLH